jgi:para-nitrobenzyl esterase
VGGAFEITNVTRQRSRFAARLFAGLLVVGLVTAASAIAAFASSAIVTQAGPVKGVQMFGVDAFLGIPYAAPPIGALRWMPPQPHAKFKGVFKANRFGLMCTQSTSGLSGGNGEDCLTLNVFTPHIKKNRNKKKVLPVMFWIHGGGLVSGGSILYDPSPLVLKGNVIVVTINYRLGLLGFFAHPAIDAEGHANGNYGLMDQQFALKWVKSNIAKFGGDPNRVTIFGESAGGQSVYANLASPTAAGLFAGAIAQSGAYAEFQDYWDFIVPLASGEPAGTSLATSLGCANQTAACLRALSPYTLSNQNPATGYPFVDGTVLTETPTAAFTSGHFNQVPVMSGGTHDEWRAFVAEQYDVSGHPLVTVADYDAAVLALWLGVLGPIVETTYPFASYPSPGVALGASGTDGIFACPERNSVQLLSQFVTTYAYEFNDENAPKLFAPTASFPLGAYHASELQYLFDINLRFAGFDPFTPGQQQLSDAMISYWTKFAATGDPNSPIEPTWSPYSTVTDEFQSLAPPTPVVETTFDADHKCSSLWNTF